MLNDSILQNGSLLSNDSINLTINVIAENFTGRLVPESSILSQFFPIITLIIGSLLTYFLNILQDNRVEKKELYRYEYTLVMDILDIVAGENAQNEMTEYYRNEKRRHFFIKTKNYKSIMKFMRNIIEGEASDVEEIKAIRDVLKKKI